MPATSQPAFVSKQAFADLYETTHTSVYRYVFGLVSGHVQEAEDITAETYIKAWDARQRFSGNEDDAINWLFTIAKRLVIDRWRKHKIRPMTVDIDHAIVAAADASLEERTAIKEQSAYLMMLLHKLPDDKREMIVLRYHLNWSINRIAAYLDKKPNTVSVTIRRTLDDLRRLWQFNQEVNDEPNT